MARFTHLAPARDEPAIRRGGIRPTTIAEGSGVFAMPILPSFFASHQWLRELKRQHAGPFVAIDFVIPDGEEVLASHYSRERGRYAANEAVGVIMRAEDPRGYEVIVPRKIEVKDLRRTRRVPQVVGWR